MRTLAPIDRVTLAYVASATIAVLVAVAGEPGTRWGFLLAAHGLLVALVFLAPAARAGGPVGRFLGEWYPMLLLAALYAEIGILTIEAGIGYDRDIQRLEAWVFGSQVSYRWIRETPSPALSWALHACYLAYYPILYASPLGLWLAGRRDASRRTILAVMVTFYLCYVVFLFYPVAGPRYAFDLADNAATAVAPARLAQWLLDHGDSWGAAFPSSHVAASVVATAMALRYRRRLGLALVPFTAGLTFAVVYGQFHYAVDALAGLALGAVIFALLEGRRTVAAEARAGAAGSVVRVLGGSG